MPAIELVEDHGAFHVVDANAPVGHAGDEAITADLAADEDGRAGVGIFGGVFKQVLQHFLDPNYIHNDGRQVVGQTHLHRMVSDDAPGIFQGGIDGFADLVRLAFQANLVSIELGHLDGFSYQAIQAVALLFDDGQQVLTLIFIHSRRRPQTGHRGFNGGKRSAELVRDRIQQGRAQALTFPGGFAAHERIDGAGAFDGDGDKAAQGFERLPREHVAGNAQATHVPQAHAEWSKAPGVFHV